jgi:hypothetical protein
VDADDAVLIGNRVDRDLPIVDEVADVAALPAGRRAAIEVAPAGSTIVELSDPLRLGVLLELGGRRRPRRPPRGARRGRHRTALVVRAAGDGASGTSTSATGPPSCCATARGAPRPR